MEDQQQREIHFLPGAAQNAAAAVITTATFHAPSRPGAADSQAPKSRASTDAYDGLSLDLQLSISLRPLRPPPEKPAVKIDAGYVEALRWQAAEQMRMAAMEKAYAERVRELTRREMELAQSEFARARSVWEMAREEVKKAEQLKERATMEITCMEITCHSCSQKFRPRA